MQTFLTTAVLLLIHNSASARGPRPGLPLTEDVSLRTVAHLVTANTWTLSLMVLVTAAVSIKGKWAGTLQGC